MSQISRIKYSDIKLAQRFDAEYFKPEYLGYIQRLDNLSTIKPFDELILILTDGKHGGVTFTEEGVLFLRNTNIVNGLITIDERLYISENESNESKRAEIAPNDILLTTIGTIGDCAIVPAEIKRANINQNLVKIRLKSGYSPIFITTFLNSKFGKFQTQRMSSGNVQPLLNYPKIKQIKIPLLSESFQLSIEEIVKSAHRKQTDSKSLYTEAEKLLLSELGLLDYQVRNTLTFSTTRSAVSDAGRYDSEYFQPKYEDLLKRIREYPTITLDNKEYIKIITGTYSQEYLGTGDNYIRSVNINEDLSISLDDMYKTQEKLDTKFRVKKGDIVTSRVGSIGTLGYITDELNGSFISDNILRIRNTHPEIDGLFLAFYLKRIGSIFMERLQRGSVQQRLNQETLKEIIIPLIKPSIQSQIAEKIQESHRLRKESRELLERAKKMVEEEIEKGVNV